MSDQRRIEPDQAGFTLSQACMFLAVVASLIAFSSWVVLQIKNNRTESKIAQIDSKQTQLEQRSQMLNQYETNLKQMIGLEAGTSLNEETVNTLKNDAVEQYEGIDEYQGSISDLAQLLEEEIQRLARKHRRLQLMNSQVDQKLSFQESRLQRYKDVFSSRRNYLTTYKQNLATEREQLEQQISNVQENTNEALDSLDSEMESLKNSHDEKMQQMDIERSGIATKISELKAEQKAEFITVDEKDGKIIRTESELPWVHINIGSRDRVKAGIQFGVYSSSDGNERIRIGMIKAKQVFSDYSRCKIISEKDPSRPVLEGDEIANPFFSTRGPKRISIMGTFPNENKLTKAIKSAGSTFQEEISPNLDFVIAGTNFQQSNKYSAARNLGILLSKFQHFRAFINN